MRSPCAECGLATGLGSEKDHRATVRYAGTFARTRFEDLPGLAPHRVAEVAAALVDLAEELDSARPRSGQFCDLREAVAMLDAAGAAVSRSATTDRVSELAHLVIHRLSLLSRLIDHRASWRDTVGEGRVSGLHVSRGGVPKAAVPDVRVEVDGLTGDRQGNRTHHGRPWQAVCLWSAEVIDRLIAEGHPIGPGAAGENITVSGLDWAMVIPGLRLEVGAALVEIQAYAVPCAKNNRWFSNGDAGRIHHDRGPGMSRVYGWVVQPGHLAVGDPVRAVT